MAFGMVFWGPCFLVLDPGMFVVFVFGVIYRILESASLQAC